MVLRIFLFLIGTFFCLVFFYREHVVKVSSSPVAQEERFGRMFCILKHLELSESLSVILEDLAAGGCR